VSLRTASGWIKVLSSGKSLHAVDLNEVSLSKEILSIQVGAWRQMYTLFYQYPSCCVQSVTRIHIVPSNTAHHYFFQRYTFWSKTIIVKHSLLNR